MTDYPDWFVTATCDDLLLHVNACRAIIKAVEWDYESRCPICRRFELPDGHTTSCALKLCLEGQP